MGVIFQLPIGILAVSRLGIVTPKQLAQNRRYAYLAIAVVAMALPGTDPVSMLLEMAPLIVLFEASLVVARVVGTPAQADPHTEIATAESAL
jgi:sec-independent protein translocase protein TatC